MQDVEKFLLKNGFKKTDKKVFQNDLCEVTFEDDHYCIADNEGSTMYSPNLNIYWLIGALTYLGFMNKNYQD
jgi:hypothetical protein